MTEKSLFSASCGALVHEYSGLKGLSVRLASSVRTALLCVALGTAFALPAHADTKAATSETAAASVKIIEIEVTSEGFSESVLAVGPGETVKFIVKNTGDVTRDFTIGTEHVMERRRAFLARTLASDGADIDPLQRSKLDRKNALILLPGETRELTWTFVKTDGWQFASNIAGHYEGGFKGGFRNSQVADAKPQDTGAETASNDADAAPVKEPVTAVESQQQAPAPTASDSPEKQQITEVRPVAPSSNPVAEEKTEANAEQPKETPEDVVPGADVASAPTEELAQTPEPTAPANTAAEAETGKSDGTAEAEEVNSGAAVASAQVDEQPAQAPAAAPETVKPATAPQDDDPAVTAEATVPEQPAEISEEAAPVGAAANADTASPVEAIPSESVAEQSVTSEEAATAAKTEEDRTANPAEASASDTTAAQVEDKPETLPQTAAVAPGVTGGPASEEELIEAAGEDPKVPSVPIPLAKPKQEESGEETAGDVAVEQYPSVTQHARVSKLRSRGLKAKRERDRRRKARPGIQTNFNGSRRITPVVSDQGVTGQLNRNERGLNPSRATSRAYEDDRVRVRAKDNVQRRVRRERNRFATEGYTLRGREDSIVDDFVDEDLNKVARHDLSASQFHAFSNRAAAEGFHPVYVDGYLTEGGVRFAGIWERRSKGRWIARHGLTSREYQDMYDRYTGEGYKLIHVSGYWDGNEEKYAAIWNR